MPFGRPTWQRVALLAILGAALWLRLSGIRFGLPALNDPDELMFEMGAVRMLRGPTLNPGWFGHPATTTMYVLAIVNMASFAVAFLSGMAASAREFADMVYADPSLLILPGRIAMTGFAIASIIVTWRLAARLVGPIAALAAAALLAANPVHVTYSQIIRSDMMACVFMLLCMLAATDVATRGTWRAYMMSGIWLGVAVATKWPFALTALSICGATWIVVRDNVIDRRPAIIRLLAAGGVGVIALLLVSPFLLIDHATAIRNLHGEGQVAHLGATGSSFWDNLRWYAAGPLASGFGVAGAVLMALGMAGLHRHGAAPAILLPVAAAFLVLLCGQHLVWERWALPLMPLGAIVAGAGLSDVANWIRARAHARGLPWVVGTLLTISLTPLAVRAVADNALRMNDTRQLASAWARENIPPGATVLIEHFAFDILPEPWRFLFPMGDAGCVDVRAYLAGKISYETIDRARSGRSNVDYGTVAPDARGTCRADFMISTQLNRYAQERYRFPMQYRAYRALEKRSRIITTIEPQVGKVGGPVVSILDLRR